MTAELLRDGGARLAALGAELSIDTGFDATTFALAVGPAQLGEALDLLAAAFQRPDLGAPSLEIASRKREEAAASPWPPATTPCGARA